MRECTFRPKLYWANKVSTTKRKPIVDVCSQGSSCKFTASKPREQSRSLSPYRETVSDSRQIASRRMAAAAKRMSTMKAPVRQIPIKGIPPADSDDNNEEPHQDMSSELSLLRKHHGIIRGRNAARQEEERRRRRRQQSRFPNPPLPREIEIKASLRRRTTTTTGMDSPIRKRWGLGPRRRDEESISPLRIPNELATRHLETSPLAPRIIFCGTTVGGESETTQTQMTEYGSI